MPDSLAVRKKPKLESDRPPLPPMDNEEKERRFREIFRNASSMKKSADFY